MEWGMISMAPDKGRAGICMQGFMVMNLPAGYNCNYPLGCQDGDTVVSRICSGICPNARAIRASGYSRCFLP